MLRRPPRPGVDGAGRHRLGLGRAQPAAFAHLVVDRAWPPGDYTERTVASILSEVVAPPA
jgi:hypothetical protein